MFFLSHFTFISFFFWSLWNSFFKLLIGLRILQFSQPIMAESLLLSILKETGRMIVVAAGLQAFSS